LCAACVYTRRAAPDWTAYYRENQFHQAFIAFIAEHDLGAWRWHEHRGRRRFGSTARARSTGGSRILLPWACGAEERDTPRQRASVRALASLLAREGAPLAGADAAQPAAGRGRPGAPLRRGAVHLLRVEEVPQGAGFFTAARAQDIRRAAVAALETATAKAVAPPPPLVGDAVTEPASVGHYPAAVAALETAVCVAARNTALKALMVIVASSPGAQQQLVDSGGLALLARLAGDGAAAEPKLSKCCQNVVKMLSSQRRRTRSDTCCASWRCCRPTRAPSRRCCTARSCRRRPWARETGGRGSCGVGRTPRTARHARTHLTPSRSLSLSVSFSHRPSQSLISHSLRLQPPLRGSSRSPTLSRHTPSRSLSLPPPLRLSRLLISPSLRLSTCVTPYSVSSQVRLARAVQLGRAHRRARARRPRWWQPQPRRAAPAAR
jgi:hypothetical protein